MDIAKIEGTKKQMQRVFIIKNPLSCQRLCCQVKKYKEELQGNMAKVQRRNTIAKQIQILQALNKSSVINFPIALN